MGCIEIHLFLPLANSLYRLIETWDVLKYSMLDKESVQSVFNRNMGCIEIILHNPLGILQESLIETWDVLKCNWDTGSFRPLSV